MSVIEGLKTGCGLLAVMVGFSDHPTREVERTSGGCAEQALSCATLPRNALTGLYQHERTLGGWTARIVDVWRANRKETNVRFVQILIHPACPVADAEETVA